MFARAAGPGRGRLLAAALSNTQPAAATPTAAGIFSRDPIAVSDHITLCHAASAVLTSGAGRALHPGLGSVSLRDKFDLFRSPGPRPSQTWTLPCTDQTKPAALVAKLLSITKAKYFQRNGRLLHHLLNVPRHGRKTKTNGLAGYFRYECSHKIMS